MKMQTETVAAPEPEKLPRNLGLAGIWLLAVNGMIGAGIFGLPGGAVRYAGEWSPFIYVVCALLILPILLCFAELASYYRGTGGPIRYVTDAFGSFIGFQAGWLFYVIRVVSFSANSVLLVDSIGYFWPEAAGGSMRLLLLALICFGLTFINVIGNVRAIRSLAILTIAKLFVLIGLVFAGIRLFVMPLTGDAPLPAGELDFGAATFLLIYAYVGFESAVVPAGEARDPARDMPRALLLSLGVVALLYLAIQLVATAAVPDLATSTTPLLDAAAVLLGPVGAMILMLGVLASVGGNLVGAIFSSPRISYALALDGRLPTWFAAVHPRFLTPANSIVVFGVVSFLLAALGTFIFLAATTILSRLLMYILVCAAVPRLRARFSPQGGFVLPGGQLVPILGIAASISLLIEVSRASLLLTAGFVLVGSGLYELTRRQT